MPDVKKWVLVVLALLVSLSLVPLALIAKARFTRSENTQWHVFLDMDQQGKFKTQQSNPLFRDGRASRAPVPGTVARGRLHADDAFARGVSGSDWTAEFPVPVTEDRLARGQERYAIFCAPCHGLSGYGDGIVARRADRLQEGTWVPPSSFHTDLVRSRPVGHLFNTATHGIRNMAGYGSQISTEDRWAIIMYVRALQRSQSATPDDVPAERRAELQ
jgi:mono/diheme cytochrome c family protein